MALKTAISVIVIGLNLMFSVPALAGDLLIDAVPAAVAPRENRVTFVPRVKELPTLDGRLDEPLWKQAGVINRWIDRVTGVPGATSANLRILAGPDSLYLGFTLSGIEELSFKEPKGGDEYGGSVLELFFDPNNNGITKVQIVTNPLGLRYDAYDHRKDWTGKWTTASSLDNDTWTTEIAIPYAEMNNQRNSQLWKANIGIVLNNGDAGVYSWTGGWNQPDTDYGVLFFGDRKAYEQTLRTKATLFLDRKVYDVRDAAAKALLYIDAVGEMLDKIAITVRTLRDERIVAEQTVSPLPSPDMSLTIDLRSLPVGDYTLHVDVKRNGKIVTTTEQPFSKRDRGAHPPAQMSGRIPIRVHAQPDLPGVRWPISTGVPFSPGSLTSTDHVRLLDPDGKEVPCQISVRATWSPHGPVQWLGVDFIPTLVAEAQQYTFEYGPNVRRNMTANLKVEQTDNAVTVDTGPLRFTVDRKQFNLIASAALNGREVLSASTSGGGGGLSLVDHEGNRYHAALDREVEVVVEEAGPIRTTICAKGWYVREGSDGSSISVELPTDRLCLFIVRLSAFAGLPLIKAAVSTTITYDSTKVRLRELTVGLPVGEGRDVNVGDVKLADQGYLLQHRWDRSVDQSGEEHCRADGWLEARGNNTNITFAMRRFWQLFPKEIGYANGVVTFHPWPAHGRDTFGIKEQLDISNIYKLWYAHQGRELDFTMPDAYFEALDAYYASTLLSLARNKYYPQMKVANAQGLNIHNDLLIAFDTYDGRTLNKLANIDPHAAADPQYVCATGVFGPLLHADKDFAQLEKTFARGFEHITAYTQQAGKEYGMFIFGNLHNGWRYGHNSGHLHRVWSNGHYHIARIPFIQYARTGNPMWMQWGRDHANTLRDIAMVHYVSAQRSFPYHQLGAMYHCKGFAPWAGDAHVAAHPICMDHLIYDYYLFGNRRGLDALQNWIDGIKASSPGGYATREGMATMAELIEAYRFTWDAALIELIERFRAAILREPFEQHNSWDFHTLLLARDWSLTGDARMLDAFRQAVEKNPKGNSHYGIIHYDGFFALLDKDRSRVERYPAIVYREAVSIVDRPDLKGDGLSHSQWIRFAYQLHKFPYLLKAMKHFNLKPRCPSLTDPMPIPVAKKTARIVVKEISDQPIELNITSLGHRKTELPLRVIRDDGIEVVATEVPATPADQPVEPVVIEIPADGRVGEYLVVIEQYDMYTCMLWPLTNLKREVAVTPPGQPMNFVTNWPYARFGQGARLYFAPPENDTRLHITTRSKTAVGILLLDCDGAQLDRASVSRYVGPADAIAVPSRAKAPLSLYLSNAATMNWADPAVPLVVAPRPDALFTPKVRVSPNRQAPSATNP